MVSVSVYMKHLMIGPDYIVSQADRIGSEEIPYKNIGLPAHIVEHVGLHDRKTLAPT